MKIKEKITFNNSMIPDLLGRFQIEVDSIAIAEQIKNAIDAKARKIDIDFSKYNLDVITINDDGIGMNSNDIKNNYLHIGTDFKTNYMEAQGGKGIGRCTLFRLASRIEIVTKAEGSPAFKFILDEDEISNSDPKTGCEISIEQIESTFERGTHIKLTGLREIEFGEIEENLTNLLNPLKDKKQIKINVKYPESHTKNNNISVTEALKMIPFQMTLEWEGKSIKKYEFICKMENKVYYKNTDKSMILSELSKMGDLDGYGLVKIFIGNFYLDNKFTKEFNIPSKREIQSRFLDAYQGINIYRGDVKIYGHGKEDWLKLAEERVKRGVGNIDNKLTFGVVELPSISQEVLIERSSREGFIKNKKRIVFEQVMKTIIKQFNNDRVEAIKCLKKVNIKPKNLNNEKSTNTKEIYLDNKSEKIKSSIVEDRSTDYSSSDKPKQRGFNIYDRLDELTLQQLDYLEPKISDCIMELDSLSKSKKEYKYSLISLLRTIVEISAKELDCELKMFESEYAGAKYDETKMMVIARCKDKISNKRQSVLKDQEELENLYNKCHSKLRNIKNADIENHLHNLDFVMHQEKEQVTFEKVETEYNFFAPIITSFIDSMVALKALRISKRKRKKKETV